jgi:hypothetical protein
MFEFSSRARALLLGSLLTSSLGVGSLAHADSTVTVTPEARAHFVAGVNLLKDPDGPRYEEAYSEFKAAYAASPSYKILGNLGLCAMKLERDDEAIEAYKKYLAEGTDLSPAEIAQVKTDLATLATGVVYLTVTTDPPGAKIVDVRLPVRGERITNVYGPITGATRLGVRQGSHQVTARLDGYPDVTWEIEATAGGVASHAFTFKKAEGPTPVAVQAPSAAPVESPKVATRPVTAGVYVGAVVTGLLATGAVVTGLSALGKHSDFQADNNGSNPAQAQSDKNTGETMNLINDVCVGGAVAAAVVTVVLYAARPTVMEDANGGGRASWSVTPFVGQSGGGLGMSGRF